MSEKLTPRQASLEASVYYQTHKTATSIADEEARHLNEARNAEKQAYAANDINERVWQMNRIPEIAVNQVQAQILVDHAEHDASEHYNANQEAYIDAARAEAMLDGVHIDVQQSQEPAQPIEVNHGA